jgi:hypothetical protein
MKGKPKRKPAGVTARRQWKAKFLQQLAECGNVRLAAEAACVGRATAYNHRESDKDFAAKWDEAMEDAADVLEAEARRRAAKGVDEPVIYEGKLCGTWIDAQGHTVAENTPGAKLIPLTVKKYSDTLLIFLLKGARPQKYRDHHYHQHDGNVGILRTAADGETAATQLLDEIRERLGVDGAAA